MIELGFYEKTLAIKKKSKHTAQKVILIVVCAVALCVWLLSALLSDMGFLACLGVSAVIVCVPVAFSSFSATELEFTVSESCVSMAMIYGGKKRKEVFTAYADDILLIAPHTPANLDRAESYSPKEIYSVIDDCEKGLCEWLIVFSNDKDDKFVFIFAAEDGIQKILKALKPAAISFR